MKNKIANITIMLLGLGAVNGLEPQFASAAFASPGKDLQSPESVADLPAPALLLESGAGSYLPLPHRAMPGSAVTGRFNPGALNAARLRLDLPDGRSLRVNRSHESWLPRGDHGWVGEIQDQPGSLVTLTQVRGVVSGFIHYGAETWEVESDGPGRSRLYRVDEDKFPPEGPITNGAHDGASATIAAEPFISASVAEPVTQDILVVYTDEAANAHGGADSLRTKTVSAVNAANAAYQNSAIGITLNLVGFERVAYAQTGDMGVSLSDLRGTTDGKMDEVHTRRNQLGADLVSLLTSEGNYCGIAYLGSASGSPSNAFSVVSPGCFSGHTFAHELGHNQGNHHDRINGDGSPAYPYAYGYRTCDYPLLANGQSFRTVMAYSCSGTGRVNYFSNPNKTYNTAPMGIAYETDPANSADNARSMNNTAAVIAAYRSGSAGKPPNAPSSLNGSAPAFDRISLSWQDNSNDESGFTLQRSVSGGSWYDRATLSANTSGFSDLGLTGNTQYAYRVRAYNSAGVSLFSNEILVRTPSSSPSPGAPDTASLTISGLTVNLQWSNVEGETGYEIQRETYNDKRKVWTVSPTLVTADVTSQSLTLSTGTYRFKIRAYNGAGNSSWVVFGCATCSPDGSFTLASTGVGGKGGGKK